MLAGQGVTTSLRLLAGDGLSCKLHVEKDDERQEGDARQKHRRSSRSFSTSRIRGIYQPCVQGSAPDCDGSLSVAINVELRVSHTNGYFLQFSMVVTEFHKNTNIREFPVTGFLLDSGNI